VRHREYFENVLRLPPRARIILSMREPHNITFLVRALACCLAAAAALFQACGPTAAPPSYVDASLLQAREERDQAFKSSGQSPLPERDRERFQGLDYFPVNPALRYHLRLNRYPVPERVRLATNSGEIRDGLRYGYFEFSAEGRVCRLQAYRMDDGDNSGQPVLFIPFRDATSGKETYAAGRYIDLPENTSGVYELDFNRAYNPFCAYSEHYSCPIPPDENRLHVPIRAGEKSYKRLPPP
jgi:uncharacterized protein (DUF1684 family)